MRWVVGLVVMVAAVAVGAVLIVAVVSSDETAIVDLDVGDCFDLAFDDDTTGIERVQTVDCDEPHEAEVVLTGELNPDGDREYPSDAELFAEIDRRCATVPDAVQADFGLLPIAPVPGSWESFSGRFLCVAIPFGGGTVVGSLAAG